jgi:CubicO group peptidase (beta-lactamase class C family)
MAVRGWCLVGLLALSVSAVAAERPVGSPESVLDQSTLALIPEAVRLQVAAGQIPGAIVLVARNDKVVFVEARGAAHPGGQQPLTAEQIFGAGSLTKAVTAVAVMMLVEDGRLGLDEAVSRYIPEFGGTKQVRVLEPGSPPAPFSALPGPVPPKASWGEPRYSLQPANRPVTLRMLLNHTSGMQIYGVANASPRHGPGDTLATFVPNLAAAPLEFQPGSRWAYSNSIGYEVLARVVELAAGMDFRRFLQERLFGPLGMNETDFGVKRALMGRALPFMPGFPAPVAEDTVYFSGSAGLWTTVGDWSLFARMLANDGSFSGRQFLKPETLRQMAADQIGPLTMQGYPFLGLPTEGLSFGLGLMTVANPEVAGTRLPVGSFGWNGDGTRLFWVVPGERIVIVSLVPLVGSQAAPLQRSLEAIVMAATVGSSPRPAGPGSPSVVSSQGR